MRKLRTRALSAVLAFGLSIGLLPGFGMRVFAEEAPAEGTSIEETLPEEETSTELGTEVEQEEVQEEETSEDAGSEEVSTEEPATEVVSGQEDKEEIATEATEEKTAGQATETTTEKTTEEDTDPSSAGKSSGSGMGVSAVIDVADGWKKSGKKWTYYVDGEKVTGWQQIESKWYYFNENGIMQTGWLTQDTKKYYLDSAGVRASGWKKIDSKQYYFNKKGVMQTGWQTIEDEKYFFNSDGTMASGVWKGDLYLRDDGTATDEVFSREYMTSNYYKQLQTTLKNLKGEDDIMKRVLAIAQSQEGYKNYAMAGYDPAKESENGYLWTGTKLRSNGGTGNTEYTRWAQRYVTRRAVSSQYADCDWCAIFASWCLYQGGIYSGQEQSKKNWYFSYCADPRVEKNSILTSFNCDQAQVWYTPLATKKIAAYEDWNTYVHTEVDPYEIPYRPGGLIFFSWDGTGRYFSHVGIVVDYNAATHTLKYISGNCSGTVLTYDVYYDKKIWSGVTGYDTIMAYAEYYEGKEGWKISKDKLYYYQKGKAVTGWKKIDGREYYFNDKGVLKFGWVTDEKKKYYMNSAGYKTVGWKKIGGYKYYFDKDGVMATGTVKIGNETYSFSSDGKQRTNGWWGGYQYDANGKQLTTTKAKWHSATKGWWYGYTGFKIKDQTVSIDGKKYTFDKKGYRVDKNKKDVVEGAKWHKNRKGWWYGNAVWYARNETLKIKGKSYTFDAKGYWIDPAEKKGKWHKNRKGWWFEYTDGSYAKNVTIKIKGKMYTFNKAGYWVKKS